MARKATAAELLMEALAVAQGTGCLFDQLIAACPGLTWNQIFSEVDQLSREGRVQLTQEKPGIYRVRLGGRRVPHRLAQGDAQEGSEVYRREAERPRWLPPLQGLLVSEQPPEVLLDSGPVDVWGWRCMQCGHVVDPVAQGRYAEQIYVTGRLYATIAMQIVADC